MAPARSLNSDHDRVRRSQSDSFCCRSRDGSPAADVLSAEGINPQLAGAWYAPDSSYFVFNKDSGGGGETLQLLRYDPLDRTAALLTDGKSRNGVPSGRTALVSSHLTRPAAAGTGVPIATSMS